jgi:hypothetical protein
MPTTNERLADAAVGHAEALQRYANGVAARIVALLNRADAEIVAAIAQAIERLPVSAFNLDRLDSLLESVRSLNVKAYAAISGELATDLRKLADYEAGYQFQLFETVVHAQVRATVGVAAVNAEQVTAAALARPFQGRLLREWMADIEGQRAARVRDAVRMGYIQQETIQQIVTRIRGTRANRYADGLLEIDRRSAEAVVRTAVSHTAAYTRERFMAANDDLIKAVSWTATLDTRTSEICRVRDGKRYTNDAKHKPIGHSLPWLGGPGRAHWNCRSVEVPVLKSWRELGIDADEVTDGTRASMDGQVPADQTFGQWIKRQSAERQDDILGPTRGKLLRDGGLTLDRFYSDKGRYLTLDELRARDAAAFKRAGVD